MFSNPAQSDYKSSALSGLMENVRQSNQGFGEMSGRFKGRINETSDEEDNNQIESESQKNQIQTPNKTASKSQTYREKKLNYLGFRIPHFK